MLLLLVERGAAVECGKILLVSFSSLGMEYERWGRRLRGQATSPPARDQHPTQKQSKTASALHVLNLETSSFVDPLTAFAVLSSFTCLILQYQLGY